MTAHWRTDQGPGLWAWSRRPGIWGPGTKAVVCRGIYLDTPCPWGGWEAIR